MTRLRPLRFPFGLLLSIVPLFVGNVPSAAAQNIVLQLDPAHTAVRITLNAALHTMHGAFQLKTGTLQLDTASGKISGTIVVDARSGNTGNGMRDRKMHKEVLESEHYPEIAFRADRLEGPVAPAGKSSVKLHGIFSVHGADHEITVPAEVDIGADHWDGTVRFAIPYAAWGIKNPSNFFLHVSDSVEVEIEAAGSVTKNSVSARNDAGQ